MLAVIACLMLGACGSVTLHAGLSEAEANQIVSVLARAKVKAEKVTSDQQVWAIQVASDDFAAAVDTLAAAGLPRPHFETLGNVFKKEGFVSSPTEEQARLVYGISQELTQSLTEIDGVVRARVHLSIPERDPLAETAPEPSASVILQHQPGAEVAGRVDAIKKLVAASVEGLSAERVSVAMFVSDGPRIVAKPRLGAANGMILGGIVALCGALLLGAPAILAALRNRRRRVA